MDRPDDELRPDDPPTGPDPLAAAWRAIPLPVDAGRGRERFLAALPDLPAPRRRPASRRWLVAASLLIAMGLWGGVLANGRRASASSDVVERLVDWNLRLAEVGSPDERNRLVAEATPGLLSEVERANLPDADRALAESLLANAPWLAENADPLAEADRFNDLADDLLRRVGAATAGGDGRKLERFAKLYKRVVARGIEPKFERAERSGALDFERGRKLERLVLRDAGRMDTLVELLEAAPDASRKEIKDALGIHRKKARPAAPESPRKAKAGKKKGRASAAGAGPVE